MPHRGGTIVRDIQRTDAPRTTRGRQVRALSIVSGIGILLLLITSCEEAAPSDPSDPAYVAVISKGESHSFWQQLKAGAENAGEELGVDVTYDGPESEDRAAEQATMFETALDNDPDAIALASIDTASVQEYIEDAQDRSIPIIGFDSGVPEAPSGAVFATASTDNVGAGATAAQKIFAEASEAIGSATSEDPVTISVLNINPTIQSVADRALGFRDELIALITSETNLSESDIAVTGSSELIDEDTPTAGDRVYIEMLEPNSTDSTGVTELGEAVMGRVTSDGIVAVFCTNESTANGVISATNDGADLNNYPNLVVVGFDAGADQKTAVREQYFLGSIAQDSYTMGFDAVTLANRAHLGESVSDIGTAGVFYDHSNMDDDGIANILYE
ncbi:MAG: substrate-binding domain-containing protein [Alkalispirochaeta sp.]